MHFRIQLSVYRIHENLTSILIAHNFYSRELMNFLYINIEHTSRFIFKYLELTKKIPELL